MNELKAILSLSEEKQVALLFLLHVLRFDFDEFLTNKVIVVKVKGDIEMTLRSCGNV